MRKSFTTTLWLSVLIFLVSSLAMGQGTTSRVTGTVIDEKGSAVPGAVVMLTSEATQTSITTETTSSGIYVFDSVQVGAYTVTVEKQGFKKFVSTGNQANVNQPTTVNVTLEVGAIEQVVQVMASAEAVQTSSSGNFGNTVEERSLEALPIVGNRGRNPLNFVLFQPGVARTPIPAAAFMSTERVTAPSTSRLTASTSTRPAPAVLTSRLSGRIRIRSRSFRSSPATSPPTPGALRVRK